MKRILFGCIAALALAGAASAQATASPPGAPPKQPAQTITVSGKLEVVDGFIGIKADGVSYILPRVRMLVGFVPAIQEGAQVKIEGYAYPIPARAAPQSAPQGNYSVLMITKLSIAGKDYDFGQFGGQGRGGRGGMMGRGFRGGMMGGGFRGGMMGGGW